MTVDEHAVAVDNQYDRTAMSTTDGAGRRAIGGEVDLTAGHRPQSSGEDRVSRVAASAVEQPPGRFDRRQA
jgi:hypothetical protein